MTLPTTVYTITSDPPGAQIYRGRTPDRLEPYVTTPYTFVTAPGETLGWSDNYFQARRDGYAPSDVRHQPVFQLGTPTQIHFVLKPSEGETAEPVARTPVVDEQQARRERRERRAQQAREREAARALAKKVAAARAAQPCTLEDGEWVYLGSACVDGLAHGQGRALHTERGSEFTGRFDQGRLAEGEVLSAEGVPEWDGPMAAGRPHGHGICHFEGEPEECRQYRGKRVDAIHKQRAELARQREEMAAMRAELESMRAGQAPAAAPAQAAEQPVTTPASNPMLDAAKSKAAGAAVDALFDVLF